MTDIPPSLFTQPAPPARRRHRRRPNKMGRVPHPTEGRRQRQELIHLHLKDIWAECFREGCSAESWERAGLADTYLRAARELIRD